MSRAIAGFFHTPQDAEAAYEALLASGFSRDDVSLVTGDTRGHQIPAVGPLKDSGADSEAPQDAWIGGAVGLVAGMFAFLIPGIGPLLAIGPLAGAIGGMGVGAAVGGVVGLLKEHGISEEEAEFYAEGVKRGGALVTVHGIREAREKDAREILDKNGAITVEDLGAELQDAREEGRETEGFRKAG